MLAVLLPTCGRLELGELAPLLGEGGRARTQRESSGDPGEWGCLSGCATWGQQLEISDAAEKHNGVRGNKLIVGLGLNLIFFFKKVSNCPVCLFASTENIRGMNER